MLPENRKIQEPDGTYDVIIVGARVAGAATALLLARAGLRVVVIDRDERGSDTLSTHALMRGGAMLLQRWGLLARLRDAGTPLITGTSFHYGDEEIAIALRSDDDCPGLLAPRRSLLDAVLVDAAEAAGAVFHHRTVLRALERERSGCVTGVGCQPEGGAILSLRAPLVIGADGLGSRVARLVAAPAMITGRHSATNFFAYVPGSGSRSYHWHYRPGIAAGVIPTNGDQNCVFASMSTSAYDAAPQRAPGSAFVRIFSALSPGIAAASGKPQSLSVFRGRPGHLRHAHGPGWALVGDAGFFRDPLTAHGMTDALRDAEGLAAAILTGRDSAFAHYQAERDSFAVPLLEVTDRIVSFSWTMDELKQLHRDLSSTMKAEAAAIAARAPQLQPA
jgi:2-polyprenyl-6-methoxyphenol hydroxylase-like FAD-dependent oxidoreductase